jgi:predicted transposase/invertase (TIGR01784 family)
MVRDLLHGFAARDWSAELDLDSLTLLPASYVSHDLRQRHGDLVWRLRFKDDRWLYVVLLLEFQSAVDRSMAVRMLTYTALLYQKLIAEGVLRERSGLPPVLPVVIYNGRRPWTAPVDVAELIASGRGAALARYQPSQRYFLVDEARVSGPELPSGNLVSALIALETNRDRARAPALLGALIDLLRKQDDEELTAAFGEWAAQVLLPRRFGRSVTGPLPRLEEVRAMLAETVQEWTAEWVEQGREQGREQGQRELLCRQAARKFDAAAAERLAARLEGVEDADRLAQVGDWIIECETADALFARLDDDSL